LFSWQDVVWIAGKARDLFSALQTVNILAFPTIFSGGPKPLDYDAAGQIRNPQSEICNRLAGEARAVLCPDAACRELAEPAGMAQIIDAPP